ncbi:acyl-CoA N-acyltransferase [Schizophyllum amplum]|uniref:Acyl-CoA N-acyltransferase n=1 Tax=Schizophyllum amplum TaxID=97359 RepID=A0A550CX01_9AGAR|nr:acyl-CoA N-acyltransferase [Auriculariopsis ampla]
MVRHNLVLTSPTGKLVLVAPTAQDDDDAIAKMRTHPETLRYLSFLPRSLTLDEVAARREARLDDPKTYDFNVYPAGEKGGKPLAVTGIMDIEEEHDACEAGIIVDPGAHRTGLGTEVLYTVLKFAFEKKKLHRVQFQTSANNDGMRGWLDRVAGACYEGTRRDGWKGLDGLYTGIAMYSILEDEWREKTKPALLMRMRVEDK